MDKEQKFWLCLWLGFAICAVVASLGIFKFSNDRMQAFIDAGYTRKTMIGYEYPQWVLPEKEVKNELGK